LREDEYERRDDDGEAKRDRGDPANGAAHAPDSGSK
jgi:hypothetical protein